MEVATLSDRLETRKLVERAKGLLQAKQGMTEPEAFKWIQRAAMDRRTTMKRVAEVVLETLDAPDARVTTAFPTRRLTAISQPVTGVAFANITHTAMGWLCSTRSIDAPADRAACADADDNVDTEVKRARSHGT